MKESHKRNLGILKSGLIKIAKIIWIVIKSFFEAITWDFYDNVKKYWKKAFKKFIPIQKVQPEQKEKP